MERPQTQNLYSRAHHSSLAAVAGGGMVLGICFRGRGQGWPMALPATSRFEPASLQSSIPLRVIELPPPPKPLRPSQIRGTRQAFTVSQVVFARLINVIPSAVEVWTK